MDDQRIAPPVIPIPIVMTSPLPSYPSSPVYCVPVSVAAVSPSNEGSYMQQQHVDNSSLHRTVLQRRFRALSISVKDDRIGGDSDNDIRTTPMTYRIPSPSTDEPNRRPSPVFFT